MLRQPRPTHADSSPAAPSSDAAPQPTHVSLQGRSALITGGTSGIGLAIVRRFTEAGADATIVDIAAAPSDLPDNIRFLQADVRTQADVDALSRRFESSSLDLLVISAGIGVHQRLTDGDVEAWQHTMDVNVMGALRVIRAVSPALARAEHGGDVVILSSVAGERPYPWGGVYCASKAALSALAETLRLELQPDVRVLNIMPGVVDTPFFSNSHGSGPGVDDIGWGSLSADDVAEAVCWGMTRPRHVAVNTIVIRPAAQEL